MIRLGYFPLRKNKEQWKISSPYTSQGKLMDYIPVCHDGIVLFIYSDAIEFFLPLTIAIIPDLLGTDLIPPSETRGDFTEFMCLSAGITKLY